MKPRVLIALAFVVALAVAAWWDLSHQQWGVLANKPAQQTPSKVSGDVVALPKEFVVNLADDRYAKVSVAVMLGKLPEPGKDAQAPPDGYAGIPQEAIIRDTITDALTNVHASDLLRADQRRAVRRMIISRLRARTDLDVHTVLITDLTVQ